MQVTYKDIVITYNESEDTWDFTLRGRERGAASLKLAKEAINKPVPVGEKEKFEPVKGWLIRYGEIEEATLTSIAKERYGMQRGRFTVEGKAGQVHPARDFYPLSEANAKLIDHIRQLAALIKEKRKEYGELCEKLKKYDC